jgi:hypothetical protein
MVRTKEANAVDPDEQQRRGTAGEEASLIGTTPEQQLAQDLHVVVSTMLETMLLGNVNCAKPLADLSAKVGQVCASQKDLPGISLADGWLTEPEWVGESSEAAAETAAGSREPEE